MPKQDNKPLPPRKEPGFISRLFGGCVGIFVWIVFSLLLSIFIEWLGIAFFWSEQGHHHAVAMLLNESRYLNQHILIVSGEFEQLVYQTTQRMVGWISNDSGFEPLLQWLALPDQSQTGKLGEWGQSLIVNYEPYLLAVPVIAQLFCVRLAIVVLSLPAFFLFALVGIVDGLVERDLRRWGGGRESSNLYNLARKTIMPLFVLACMGYLSSPVSVHPAWVIIPFSALASFSLKITFSRLKKYF
jgi:integrating conjugative element membrane protein (TIGR03747 family)